MKGSGWVAAAAAGLALLSAGGAAVVTQTAKKRRKELAADPVKRVAQEGVTVKAPEQPAGKILGGFAAPAAMSQPALAPPVATGNARTAAQGLAAGLLADLKRVQPEMPAPKLPPAFAALLPKFVGNLGPTLKPAIVSTSFAPPKPLY